MSLEFTVSALALCALPRFAAAESASASLTARQSGGVFDCAGECLNTNEIGDACDIASVSDIGEILNADDGLVQCVCDVVGGDNSTLSDCMGDCGLSGYYDSLIGRCDETSTEDSNEDDGDDEEDAASTYSPLLWLSGGLLAITLFGKEELNIDLTHLLTSL